MPDQRVLCPTCGYLVRPEHFPCKTLARMIKHYTTDRTNESKTDKEV